MNAGVHNKVVLTLCGFCSLLGVMVGTTGNAHAIAGAQSSAQVDITSMSNVPGTLGLMTTEAVTTASAPLNYVPNSRYTVNSDYLSALENVQIQSEFSDSAYNVSNGTADATGNSVSQLALAAASGNGLYSANAQTLHDVVFNATGNFTLTIDAAYDALLQVFADQQAEKASGYLLAGIYLSNLTQLTDASNVLNIEYTTSGSPDAFYQQLTGLLSVSLDFATGDAGSFRVIVDGGATAESVPEPSTLALLGFGLVGAALLRKRIRN